MWVHNFWFDVYRLLQIADKETHSLFTTGRTANLSAIAGTHWKLYYWEQLLKLSLLLASKVVDYPSCSST